jgi:hypothetical protein
VSHSSPANQRSETEIDGGGIDVSGEKPNSVQHRISRLLKWWWWARNITRPNSETVVTAWTLVIRPGVFIRRGEVIRDELNGADQPAEPKLRKYDNFIYCCVK